jgi:hypothetical protein
MSVKVLRRRGDQKVLGYLVHAYTVNIEYWIMWFMNILWTFLYLFRTLTMNIRFSGSCICFDYWIFWFLHVLWIFVYLVHAYTVNFRLFVSCICYEYWIIWIMHRLWILYSRSLQQSRLRLWSDGTLHSIAECNSWCCKGSCYLLHSQAV